LKLVLEEPSSTDSNVAISFGIPAMTLGRCGNNGDNHSINEWWDPKDA
jgi:tripeptide aminopeptidase